MNAANENDVVAAFRLTLQEELERAQSGVSGPRDVLSETASLEDAIRLLNERHEQLLHEVALLRTILLKLVSEPIDRETEAKPDEE